MDLNICLSTYQTSLTPIAELADSLDPQLHTEQQQSADN